MPLRPLLLTLALLSCAPSDAIALAAGDSGYGLTVLRGFAPERFGVEILGVLENNRLDEEVRVPGRSYLIRVSGEALEASGGISQGMSGSPVYIGGRLVGAVSSCWAASDPMVGLMIPIEEMRRVYSRLDGRARRPGAARAAGRAEWRVIERSAGLPAAVAAIEIAPAGDPAPAPGALRLTPAAGRLLVSGLSGERVGRLAARLSAAGHAVTPGPAAGPAGAEAPPLVPGSSVGLQLCRGDINVTAIGTLTERRDDGAFLAFGHEFERRGPVEFFLAPCEIHHTFRSSDMAFKIGSPGLPVGCVLEDRPQAVAGRLGRLPRVCHLRVTVSDRAEGGGATVACEIVRDPAFLPEIVRQAAGQAIENAACRLPRETASLRIRADLHGTGGDRVRFERANRGGFDDPTGFVQGEIERALKGLLDGPHAELVPDDVEIDVVIDADRRHGRIRALDVEPASLRRGGEARCRVRLERYREPDVTLEGVIAIPADLADGEYDLVAEGGEEGRAPAAAAAAGGALQTPVALRAESADGGLRKEATLATYLARLAEEGRGDRVRLRLKPAAPPEEGAAYPPERPRLSGRLAVYADWVERGRARIADRVVTGSALAESFLAADLPVSGAAECRIAFGRASGRPTAPGTGKAGGSE